MAFPPQPSKKPAPKKRPEDDDPDALGSPEGFGDNDPDDKGGPPDGDQDDMPPPPPGAGGGPPGAPPAGMDGGAPTITPEAVSFRTEHEICQNCSYMGQDGNCAVLKMQVTPNEGCSAFLDNGAGADQQQGAPPPGAGGPPMGGPPQPPPGQFGG